MPNLNTFRLATVALTVAVLLSPSNPAAAQSRQSVRGDQTNQTSASQARASQARANWTPVRGAVASTSQQPSPKGVSRTATTKRRVLKPTDSAAPQGMVTQASHQIPSPPPVGETVIYEPTVVDLSCDAMDPSCGCDGAGCDAIGCDAMGSCGPNCGCSLCGELAGGRAWRPAITLSLPQDGFVSFEALNFWTDGMSVPALVTQSLPGSISGRSEAGVLPGATVLYGGNDILDDSRTGGRLRFGFWFDRCHTVGLAAEYLELERESEAFSAASTGDPILARPFYNVTTGMNDSELIAFNDGQIALTGTVSVQAYSELVGGGVNLRFLKGCDEGCREWLFCGRNNHYCTRSEFRLGYRFMELNEGVSIHEDLLSTGTNPGTFDITDAFDTENRFNGVDLGWSRRIVRGYWTLESLIRIAVGNTNQIVRINGSTSIDDGAAQSGGLLALTNQGTFEQDEFSVLPELNLTLGYQLTDHLKATVGYTGIYWSNVVRPGEHIPTAVNPNFLPPAVSGTDAYPLFSFDTTDYWAHGLTYGLEYRW
ncbi:BBP7 family outer membrane beta-barrel protein [Stieleria sp. JC731]|uniref:BBP7 family outer membrane beta-barrel protein n=1 Tax=Pirellulaceae TaxID=2691357 RepID=UPI001E4D7A77|nr:BBP7 family outer membrane beta-barrel protein [Stieleria sp. JC731]MCC9601587.1 BBP7 family outer membrane beta-barrel protein [Stieleria sp. JC731]